MHVAAGPHGVSQVFYVHNGEDLRARRLTSHVYSLQDTISRPVCAKKRPPPPCPLIFNVEKRPGSPMQLLSTLKFRGSRGRGKFGALNHTRSLIHHTCFWWGLFFFAHTGTPRFPLHPSSCAMHSLPTSTRFLCCRYCSHAVLRRMTPLVLVCSQTLLLIMLSPAESRLILCPTTCLCVDSFCNTMREGP